VPEGAAMESLQDWTVGWSIELPQTGGGAHKTKTFRSPKAPPRAQGTGDKEEGRGRRRMSTRSPRRGEVRGDAAVSSSAGGHRAADEDTARAPDRGPPGDERIKLRTTTIREEEPADADTGSNRSATWVRHRRSSTREHTSWQGMLVGGWKHVHMHHQDA
jgi:hypothetical protein